MAPVVTMRQLLESGVHFGHQTRRWNPKMKRFIFTERNGIYIIDLQQSLAYIDRAYEFIKETVAHGGTILFVGTKKQAQEADRRAGDPRRACPTSTSAGWAACSPTSQTVHKRLKRLKELEEIDFERRGRLGHAPRRSCCRCGASGTSSTGPSAASATWPGCPSAVWIVDTKKEHIAVDEARKLGIPIVAILDTNCDPDEVDFPIPGNDDAIRAVGLLTRVVADAVAEGLMARVRRRRRRREAGHRRPSRATSRWPSGSASCRSDDGRDRPPTARPRHRRGTPLPRPPRPPPRPPAAEARCRGHPADRAAEVRRGGSGRGTGRGDRRPRPPPSPGRAVAAA